MKSSALNTLSAIYLLSASAFGVAIALQRNPPLANATYRTGAALWSAIDENAVKPAGNQLVAWDRQLFDAIDPPVRIAVTHVRHAPKIAHAKSKPVHVARTTPKPVVVARQIPKTVEPVSPPPTLRPEIAEPQRVAKAIEAPAKPTMTLVPSQTSPAQTAAANAPRPDLTAPSPAELTRVMLRLKDSLTSEMLQNFSLFLYVSKADSGPLAQRMYVFKKQGSGDLSLLYNWPVSTGRELVEFAPNGQRAPSFTPQGYYELDPDRMYKHHMSGQWQTPMPYAMFFSWEVGGRQTGLAIHSATGEDIAQLGKRASAGCVRLSPENAAALFNLIRTQYKGLAPRFAIDRRTATMSNQGLLMHDAQGNVQMAEGYKVLVFIENYGGNNVVAAVF
ncbi:MAG TPA: L,D-transpeptidase family protein [Rhizomicrobium sp.]|nr:L,D-transpeptidase family protein [Rhizomicrobium sp.]